MQGLAATGAQLPSPQHCGRIVPTAMGVFGEIRGFFDASFCSCLSIPRVLSGSPRVSGSQELLGMLELLEA